MNPGHLQIYNSLLTTLPVSREGRGKLIFGPFRGERLKIWNDSINDTS